MGEESSSPGIDLSKFVSREGVVMANALNNKGNVLYRMNEYNLAREYYLRVVDVAPNYAKAMSNLKLANRKLWIKEAV